MPVRAKTAVVGTALVLLTLWPLVHIGLVRRYDVSPWKLAGWGMYAAPRSRSLGMEVFGRPRGRVDRGAPGAISGDPLAQMTNPTEAVRAEAGRYLERHRWLRRLVRPDALAAAVATAEPAWDEVKIAVFEPDLDRTSSMVVMTVLVHRYTREGERVAYAGTEDPRSAGLPPALLAGLGAD